MRRSNFLFLLVSLLALSLSGCKSRRAVEVVEPSTVFGSVKELKAAVLAKCESDFPYVAYLAKNVNVNASQANSSYSLRANIDMEFGSRTDVSLRLTFPPLVVGSVSVVGDSFSFSSNFVRGEDKPQTLPAGFHRMMQSVVVGKVPPIYEFFGEKNFNSFKLSCDEEKGLISLEKTLDAEILTLTLNGADMTLHSLVFGGNHIKVEMLISKWDVFDGHNLPSHIEVNLLKGQSKSTAEFSISKVSLITK